MLLNMSLFIPHYTLRLNNNKSNLIGVLDDNNIAQKNII